MSDEDLASIMSEPPEGTEHDVDLDVADHIDTVGGMHVVSTASGTRTRDAGMTVHRGVIHPDEYVDREQLLRTVEAELGFSVEEVHSVYARGDVVMGGPIPANLRELRDRLDRRVLALSRAGGNMTALAEALDLERYQLVRAVSRAQGQEDGSWA